MKSLAHFLLGQSRSAVLGALLLRPEKALHVRELARLTQVSPGSLHRELRQLADMGLLSRQDLGRQVFYQANQSCPIYAELCGLLRKSSGLVDVLRQTLSPVSERLELAFVYGSMASATEHAHSDVDLLLVGDLNFSEIVLLLNDAQQSLGREINPMVLSKNDFKQQMSNPQSFVSHIWHGPKLALKGAC
jgi:predicted nucleotidyltransferase